MIGTCTAFCFIPRGSSCSRRSRGRNQTVGSCQRQGLRSFDAKPLHGYEAGQQVDYGGVRAMALSPDGKLLAAGGFIKGRIRLAP